MFDILTPPPNEKVVLAGLQTNGNSPGLFSEDMDEMLMLCNTAGADVLDSVTQRRDRPEASTYFGTGKVREIRQKMKALGCRTLVVDADLSPGQIRTIEKTIDGKVIDRSQLILDIFAKHAQTKEARIQVELAQLRTLYPRLTHAWTHFSQQVGGIGTRGPGEKQLEVDRRLVQRKISDLNQRLQKIERARVTQRKSRKNVLRATLVGYTNVGKSSLLNALSGAEVKVENKLFATLDTATRRTYIPGTGTLVISDTVGFIRRLPHHLVASFRSTLGVVAEADLLLVVIDASSEWAEYQARTVNEVLDELDAGETPRLTILNKTDRITDPFARKQLEIRFPDGVFVSAFDSDDIERLRGEIGAAIGDLKRDKAMDAIIERKSKHLQSH
jgi:GTP-binding protein HflX